MTSANPFGRIVVAYDASDAADAALVQALTLAEQYGGDVVAVNASDQSAASVLPVKTASSARRIDFDAVVASLDVARQSLYRRLSLHVASGSVPVVFECVPNIPEKGIIDAAARWEATAIAIGTHGYRGLTHALVGSVAEAVVRTADVPVIVVHADASLGPIKSALVGIDGSAASAKAARLATALALCNAVRPVYCTVINPYPITQPIAESPYEPTPLLERMERDARDALDAALQEAAASGVHPDTEIADTSDAADGIVQIAKRRGAGAIVLGMPKRGAAEAFLFGSIVFDVMRRANVPVIAVPADSPVLLESAVADQRRGKA